MIPTLQKTCSISQNAKLENAHYLGERDSR